MKYYLVGGACRDILMGLSPKDYDFVVVGASPQDMLDKGYKQVGKDFPVFLHPTYKWEIALARTERKTGVGYGGFDTEWNGVSLDEDLERRDLTINAIAIEVDWEATQFFGEPVTVGAWIDPHNGIADIKSKTLRHTSGAFSEDPLRVLRVARFLARYPDFYVRDSLYKECERLGFTGELSSLTPERVWLETEKALSEKTPSKYFDFLSSVGWSGIPSEIYEMQDINEGNVHHPEENIYKHTMMVVDHSASTWKNSEINFACLMHDLGKPECYATYGKGHGHEEAGLPYIEDWCRQWRVPNNYRDLALITCKHHQKVHSVFGRGSNGMVRPKSIMKMFEESNALKKPERFRKMLKACESDSKGRGVDIHDNYELTKDHFLNKPYSQRQYLEECLEAVLASDSKGISQKMLAEGKSGVIIGQSVREAKIKCIREVQNKWKKQLSQGT